jgi:hypothetical protein
MLTNELPPLCRNGGPETGKENQTGFLDVLLPQMSMYI